MQQKHWAVHKSTLVSAGRGCLQWEPVPLPHSQGKNSADMSINFVLDQGMRSFTGWPWEMVPTHQGPLRSLQDDLLIRAESAFNGSRGVGGGGEQQFQLSDALALVAGLWRSFYQSGDWRVSKHLMRFCRWGSHHTILSLVFNVILCLTIKRRDRGKTKFNCCCFFIYQGLLPAGSDCCKYNATVVGLPLVKTGWVFLVLQCQQLCTHIWMNQSLSNLH